MTSRSYSRKIRNSALRHTWFPIARSADLGTPQPATLLGEALVAFRDETGAARVLSRRCPHRGADLSMGSVIGDGLQCAYHGWEFSGDSGRCTKVPSMPDQAAIPSKAIVGSYPVVERFAHVWTCLEEPLLDLPDPPELHGLTLDWRAGEPIEAACGFMAATENFRDMAHFPFVHRSTMADVDPIVADLEPSRDGREVFASFDYPSVEGSVFSDIGDAKMHYHSYAPGFSSILYDYGPIGKRYLVDFPSPVSDEECVIFWALALDSEFRGGTMEQMMAIEKQVFDEDTPVLEGLVPAEIPLDAEVSEVSCPADAYTLQYRRATKAVIDYILDSSRRLEPQ